MQVVDSGQVNMQVVDSGQVTMQVDHVKLKLVLMNNVFELFYYLY